MSKKEEAKVSVALQFLPVPPADQQEEIKRAALKSLDEAKRLVESFKFPAFSFIVVELDESNSDREYTFNGNLPPPQFAAIASVNADQYFKAIVEKADPANGPAN